MGSTSLSATTPMVVYVAAESLAETMDVGTVQIFLVGRSRNGSLIAVHTLAAWT